MNEKNFFFTTGKICARWGSNPRDLRPLDLKANPLTTRALAHLCTFYFVTEQVTTNQSKRNLFFGGGGLFICKEKGRGHMYKMWNERGGVRFRVFMSDK